MTRIAVAQWRQETNTFNPKRSTLDDYRRFGLSRDSDQILARYANADELGGFLRVLARDPQCVPLPLLRAVAWSGGLLGDDAYAVLLDALLTGLRRAQPVDAVLLSLHGATAAVSTPDVAATVVQAVRAEVGRKVPIAVSLDLHANVTPDLLQAADIVVGYRCNPHLDVVETGERTAALLLRQLRAEVQPVVALRKVPALIGAERQSTFDGPLSAVAGLLRAAEDDGRALWANVYPVQPWLDVPLLASSVVVATDGDAALANALADEAADALWACHDQCSEGRLPAEEIAARVARAERWPVVISDGADSTNSGAPGDSTVLLRAFLEADTPGPILLSLVDPLAAAACSRAGVGSCLTLPVGGKMDPRTGPPLTVTGRVVACSDGRYRLSGHGVDNTVIDAGLSVVLEVGAVRLVITSHTIVGSHPKVYRSLGQEPAHARAVVAKSPYGFRHDYGPFAAEILLADCPGAATGNYLALPFRRVAHPLYPLAPVRERRTPAMEALAVRPA